MLHAATLLLPQACISCPSCPHCSFIFKRSLSLLFSHSCLLAPQLVPTIVCLLGSSPTRGCRCLPLSLQLLLPGRQREAVLHLPSSQEQSAGTECLHTGKDSKIQARAMGSSSSNEQARCWCDTEEPVWASLAQLPLVHWRSEAEPPYWRLRCMDMQHHHPSHGGSSTCIFPSIMDDLFAYLLGWDAIWYRPVIYPVEMFVSIIYALSFMGDPAMEQQCVLPAVPVSSACGIEGQKECVHQQTQLLH